MAAARRTSPVLLCVLAIALAAGAAATLVASAASPLQGKGAALVPANVPAPVLGVAFLAPIAVGFGALIYRRFTRGALRIPTPVVAAFFVVLLILAGFAILGHYLNPGGPLGGASSGGGGNTSKGTGSNGTGGGGGGSGGGKIPLPSLRQFPDWLLYVVGIVVALALVGLLLPALWAGVLRRRGPSPAFPDSPRARGRAEAALERAASDLDAGADPRTVIERLYVGLIDRVSDVAGDLSGRTPEEIRAEQLVPLGVRPAAAVALTRLFEEARYSSHPMGPEAAVRVRSAVGAAAADLARVPTPAL